MRRMDRIKRDSLRGRCKCLKQDGQDVQDGQDKEGFCSRLMSPLLLTARRGRPEKTWVAVDGALILAILNILVILLQTHIL